MESGGFFVKMWEEVKNPDINETDKIIGESIAKLIPDGATIQLGIGGIPNAIGKALMGKKDLGIHSEMFTEVMVDLILSGAVNNKKKTIHPGKVITTFAGGTKRMYDIVSQLGNGICCVCINSYGRFFIRRLSRCIPSPCCRLLG